MKNKSFFEAIKQVKENAKNLDEGLRDWLWSKGPQGREAMKSLRSPSMDPNEIAKPEPKTFAPVKPKDPREIKNMETDTGQLQRKADISSAIQKSIEADNPGTPAPPDKPAVASKQTTPRSSAPRKTTPAAPKPSAPKQTAPAAPAQRIVPRGGEQGGDPNREDDRYVGAFGSGSKEENIAKMKQSRIEAGLEKPDAPASKAAPRPAAPAPKPAPTTSSEPKPAAPAPKPEPKVDIKTAQNTASDLTVDKPAPKVEMPMPKKQEEKKIANESKSSIVDAFMKLQETKHPNLFEAAKKLKGNQHKIDANKNGEIDAHDFKLLRAKKEMKESSDYEYEMARNELATAERAIKRMMKHLKGEGNLEAWVQSKITKAADYLDSVADYMESNKIEEAAMTGDGVVGSGSVTKDNKDVVSKTAPKAEGPSDEEKKALTNKVKEIQKENVEFSEASYSAKEARAGKDIGKPGKNFEKIAKSAAKRYGSEEAGEKVAGAILKNLRKEESEVDFSEEELDHIEAVMEGRGRPPKEGSAAWQRRYGNNAGGEKAAEAPAGRDARQHIQVIAGQAAAGRNIEFTHNNGEKTTISPVMGRKITAHLDGLKPAARQDAVNKIHDSASGLKGM